MVINLYTQGEPRCNIIIRVPSSLQITLEALAIIRGFFFNGWFTDGSVKSYSSTA